MKPKVTIVLAVLAVGTFFPFSSVAESKREAGITVEALVERALAKNPELEFYQQELAAAKGEARASGLLQNPEFDGTIGRKSDASREGTAWSVSVVQPFEFPGRLALRKAIANRQVKLAELGFERFKAALAAKARISAYDVLVAQQLAQSAREVSARGQELVSVLVQREPAGVAPLLETRIIEASVILLQKKAIDAEREAQAALFELNQLSGEPFTNTLTVAPSELQLRPIPSADDLMPDAIESNFELRMKAEELRQQGFRVELARNERYPGFKVGPFISRERAAETEEVIGLGISVPLPIWNQNQGNISAAEARASQASTSLLVAQREVERAVRENALAYEKKLAEIQRWRPNFVLELREAAELGDRHYRLGAIPVSTYVELQGQYVEALEAILSMQRDALHHLQTLETVTGKRLRDAASAPNAASKKDTKEEFNEAS